MDAKFAEACDVVFAVALDLRERISVSEGDSAQEERSKIKAAIEAAEGVVDRSNPEWDLAKYALVAWIDDQMVHAPWEGNKFWDDNPLEVEYFYERVAYTEFFVKAKEAAKQPKRNALEVFYLCVVLGFRGLYGPPPEKWMEVDPKDHGLPPDAEAWAREIKGQLRLQAGRPPIDPKKQPIDHAEPLRGQTNLTMAGIAFAVALAIPVGGLILSRLGFITL